MMRSSLLALLRRRCRPPPCAAAAERARRRPPRAEGDGIPDQLDDGAARRLSRGLRRRSARSAGRRAAAARRDDSPGRCTRSRAPNCSPPRDRPGRARAAGGAARRGARTAAGRAARPAGQGARRDRAAAAADAQPLIWHDGAPVRAARKPTSSDAAAAHAGGGDAAVRQGRPRRGGARRCSTANDSAADARGADRMAAGVAWMYYVAGDDRRCAAAGGARGAGRYGDWAVQAAGRRRLPRGGRRTARRPARRSRVSRARAGDTDLRAAGLYWAARADMACGRPDRVEARLKSAAQFGETFYGQLARQALGMPRRDPARRRTPRPSDWHAAGAAPQRPRRRGAGRDRRDRPGRRRRPPAGARSAIRGEFAALTALAGRLDLPATQLWLAHNCPQGAPPRWRRAIRRPTGRPTAAGASTRRWSTRTRCRNRGSATAVVSPAGAYGLMQIMPAAATDFARETRQRRSTAPR